MVKATLFNTDEGESKRADHYKRVRNSKIEIFLPFYELSLFVIKLSKPMNFLKKITSNIKIMKYVGNGKIWDQKKLDNFIKYITFENKKVCRTRRNK